MILVIDTTERKKIFLGFFNKGLLNCFEFEAERQTEDLLTAIDGILKNQKICLKDIKAILVNQGPGSYTGTRAGATVANTLSWSLNIPVIGYQEGKLDYTLKKLSKTINKSFLHPVIPYY